MWRLPGRSPLPSVTLTRVAARRPSRTIDRSAYPHVNGGTRDPPDLGAIPDAFRSLRPGREAGFLSWGCPKIAPPSFVPWSPSPGRIRHWYSGLTRWHRGSSFLRNGNAGSHSRSALVVFHHLDGLLLHDPATVFQAAADPGVHHVSFRCETEFPAMLLLPFEAFPPPTATGHQDESRVPVGLRHLRDRFRPLRSPQTLPPRPLPLLRAKAVTRHLPDESRGLEALLHRRVRCPPCRCQPDAPGAPLGLADLPVSPA
jgi:hypothetical protein